MGKQAAIVADVLPFDQRGARTTNADVERRTRYFREDERRERFLGVWHALTLRHLLILKGQGQSTLGKLHGRGGRFDPVALATAVATIGTWLKDLTDIERDALALELLYSAVPIDHGHRPPSPRRRRVESRCDYLERTYGGSYYDTKYSAIVCAAYRKVEARMEAAGVVWDGQ